MQIAARFIVEIHSAARRGEEYCRAIHDCLQQGRQILVFREVARGVVERGEFIRAAVNFCFRALALGFALLQGLSHFVEGAPELADFARSVAHPGADALVAGRQTFG
ncbi:MAG: hypothetical protein Q8L41_08720, partial [Anaerolineales bacterium]|nr:hypothetical protein [Anaerolineales bacterium]